MSLLAQISVEFGDDDEHHMFDGYTDGRRWNGWACPHFAIDVAEKMFARINYRTRHASAEEAPHGGLWVNESGDLPTDAPYLLACKMTATVDGDLPLLDCGGWLVFQPSKADRKERCSGRGHARHADVTCEGACCTACGGPIDQSEECRC